MRVRYLSLVLTSVLILGANERPQPPAFGDALPGLTRDQRARFDDGKTEFAAAEEVDEGLGPVFNGRSCVECHAAAATGGGGELVETRFGRVVNGVFDPLSSLGGSLIQTIGITYGDGSLYPYNGEVVPKEATIIAGRRTTPLFGLGLVDAVPDGAFHALAAQEQASDPSTAGKPNLVTNVVTGMEVVGKFGWKSQVPTLFQFSADAYLNEMGITSPLFPNENCPQGNCAELEHNPAPGVNDAGDGVAAFADFMTMLAPPPRGNVDNDARAGERVFQQLGCATCHVPTLRTGPSEVAALDRVAFHPYSDFLLHDMGRLGDGIAQSRAGGRDMRTSPLWGLRAVTRFLHDGRATTVQQAILAHDGQGRKSRDAFAALNPAASRQLMHFLNSL
jgi:CxxC motif-containing protein (DUF1111 family)